MHFDTTLKDLFHQAPPRLLELLTGTTAAELLTVEYPTVRARRTDLVARLRDGRIYHLELQTQADAEMPWRMLEYYALLYRQFQVVPWQQVLAVGPKATTILNEIRHESLQFRYTVVDLATLPGDGLLASESIADNLLGLLCDVREPREAFERFVVRVSKLPSKKQADVMAQLLVLSKLRPRLLPLLKEYRHMPIPIPDDLLDDPFFAPVIVKRDELNRRLGGSSLLRYQITQRFGALPDWAENRLQQADIPTLERLAARLLKASSIEELFEE